MTAHGQPQSRMDLRRARRRMMRRRRRTVLITLLILATAGWVWQAVQRPGQIAGNNAARVSSGVQGDGGRTGSAPVHAADGHPALEVTTSHQPAPAPSRSGSYVAAGDGNLRAVPGTSRVYGSGVLRRFIVEVEGGLNEDPQAFAAFVERTLADSRSWGHGGALSFQRVASGPVAFRVTLASPRTVDRYCAPLDTLGYTSCYDSKGRAVLNQARWETGVPWYAGDMTTYREYMINHEVGHALGHAHELCPRAGAPAPVMQQQTLGMQGCRRNAWPYP